MANVNVNINLPALPDNDIWWANSAAWQAYWNSATLTISVDMATTAAAGVVKMAATVAFVPSGIANQDFANLIIDGVPVVVPTQANFNELKAAVANLNTSIAALRTAMVNAGQINNA